MIIALQIIGGLVLLLFGGEILVRGAVTIARHIGISKLIIGLTVVAVGTSAPEILVSIKAAISDHADIAIGNVVGSNISNVLLVLGITAIIAPVIIHNNIIKRDGPILLAMTVLFVALCWTSKEVSMYEGFVFIICLILYTIYTVRTARSHKDEHIEDELPPDTSNPRAIAYSIIGVACLAYGADVLVEGAASLARILEISEAVIGVTIVAIGSSTPELVTCIIAARHNHSDLVAGNIVGSNMINIMGGIGISAILKPLAISESFFNLDLWVFSIAAIAFYLITISTKKITKCTGIVFFLGYIVYITALLLQN